MTGAPFQPPQQATPPTTITFPILLSFARLLLAFVAQGIAAAIFALRGAPHPWSAAAPYWTVYGTLIDLGCFAAIGLLLRREGKTFAELLNWEPKRFGRDLLSGLGIGLGMLVLGIACGTAVTFAIYHGPEAPAAMGGIPLWAALYSTLIWPVIWGIAEQGTYQGYVLPRLVASTRRLWPAFILIAFTWALQHIALPFRPDLSFILWRFVTSLPIAVASLLIFLKTRRLMPLVVAHWLADFAAALSQVLLPLLH